MNFEQWWEQLPVVERKIIGRSNAEFVWNESRKQRPDVLFLPNFSISSMKDSVIIMCASGEGGTFDMQEFEDAVRKFFAEKF